MEKQYYLDNLDCPNCAMKIEAAINKLSKVNNASVNYVNKKLILEFSNPEELEEILKEVQKNVTSLEEEVLVIPYDERPELKSKVSPKEHKHHSHGCNDHHCNDHHDHHHHDHHHEKAQSKNSHPEFSLSQILLFIGSIIFLITFIITKVFQINQYLEIGLYISAYILVAYDIIFKSITHIIKGDIFDEFFLMSVATIGALAIKEYPEAVAVMIFYKVGEFFQDMAVDKARKSVMSLVNIKPEFATLISDGLETKCQPSEIKVDDIIEIKPGERVPLDGIIIEGSTSLDVSAITGEAKPLDVSENDSILSGSINLSGLLKVRVTKEYKNSTVSRILEMVENASDKKSHTEKFITRFAKVYTPIVVILALLLAVLPPLITKSYDFTPWVYKALSFLVVSCPCALIISVPLGYFGGIGLASKNGILVKGSNHLEALENITTIAFDKTGTLTYGTFIVTEIIPANGFSKDELLLNAAYGECKSNHPIAKAILDKCSTTITLDKLKNYEEISGYGTKILYNNKTILTGNEKLMQINNIDYVKATNPSTIVYVAIEKIFAGYIIISDQIKADSKEAISKLNSLGITHTVLLSGDNNEIAESIGKSIGIETSLGQLLPGDKLDFVENLYKTNPDTVLAYVGDGINDAPVLARANVGIAMGGIGQDAAVETADIVLMTDEVSKIPLAIDIAKFTKQIVIENIVFSLGIKLLVLVLVAAGISSMWMAVFADVGVALLAVLNSIRVIRHKCN